VGLFGGLVRGKETHGEEPEDDARPEGMRTELEAAPQVPVVEVFRRFWPYARSYRKWLPPLLLLAALGPALEAAGIWLFQFLVDEVLVPRDFEPLLWLTLAYLGIAVLIGIVSFFDDYLSDWIGEGFIRSLRQGLFEHLHRLPVSFFERRKLGDVVSRLSGDVAAIESLVLSGVVSALQYAFQLVFFVGALFFLDWRLALVSLVAAPGFLLLARSFSKRIKKAAREQRRRAGSISTVAEESFSNVALVRAYGTEGAEAARFRRENDGNFRAHMAATRLEAAFSPLVGLLEVSGALVVIAYGAWRLTQGSITLGELLVFIAFLTRLYAPIEGLGSLTNTLWEASAGAERIIEFLDEEPSVADRPGARPLSGGRARGYVELDGVSFRYPGKRDYALRDVSLRVSPGEMLALVGPSGAGKSTVARLLLRFHDPEGGAVRLDGHDLRDLTLASLRENVSVVLQETLLFDGTVRENIAYGNPHATEREILRAAKLADVDEFVRGLPEGYETRVGQKGRALSGGQRQRVAIARAILRDAPVLVLDEPTTGLDAESARRVMEPLRRLASGRTTILISHDPALARQADRVVTLEGGRVAGTTAESDVRSLLHRRSG